MLGWGALLRGPNAAIRWTHPHTAGCLRMAAWTSKLARLRFRRDYKVANQIKRGDGGEGGWGGWGDVGEGVWGGGGPPL